MFYTLLIQPSSVFFILNYNIIFFHLSSVLIPRFHPLPLVCRDQCSCKSNMILLVAVIIIIKCTVCWLFTKSLRFASPEIKHQQIRQSNRLNSSLPLLPPSFPLSLTHSSRKGSRFCLQRSLASVYLTLEASSVLWNSSLWQQYLARIETHPATHVTTINSSGYYPQVTLTESPTIHL